jgi:hypothetical protein
MGTEAIWIPLAISALSAGATAYDQNRVAREQKEESTDMMKAQQRKQLQADAILNENTAALGESSPEEERQKALSGFLETLRANSGVAGGTSTDAASGGRYGEDAAAAKADIQNYGANRSDMLSRIVAPSRQRQNERFAIGRTADEVSGVSRNADAERFLSQLRMQSIRANPWITAASQVGQGVATGMAGAAGSGGQLSDINVTTPRMPTPGPVPANALPAGRTFNWTNRVRPFGG